MVLPLALKLCRALLAYRDPDSSSSAFVGAQLTNVLVAWPDLPTSGLWLWSCTWFYSPASSRLEEILQVRRMTGTCEGWAAEGIEPEAAEATPT